MNIRLQNDSVGSYISSDNGSGLLEVDIEDDKDVYNQKNVFKTAYATIDAILSENDRFKEFKDKLQNSTLLVLIKDIDSTNSDAVEQIFLDINEKSKRLDNASIFKGYCFKIYDEAFQDELKCLWIRLKKAYISFKNFSGENYKFDEYIYMYLLVTEDENMTENLSPGGIHFLEDKNMDDVERILTKMVEYGERVSDFYKHIQNEAYIFEDICVDSNSYKTASKKLITNVKEYLLYSMETKSAQYQKVPLNWFIYSVKDKSNNMNILMKDFMTITANLYIYSFLFTLSPSKKSKKNIDHSLYNVLNEDVDIKQIINIVKELRKKQVENVQIPENCRSFDVLSNLYTIMDCFKVKENRFDVTYHNHGGQLYTLEHFIVPDNRNAKIKWLTKDEESIEISFTGQSERKKKLINYLIVEQKLNNDILLDFDVMGLVTGKYQEYDKDFIFATIQTLSKEENLQRYEKTAFDAIVIDEAHHSAANSYKKVLEYFEPKLWLGMTATPDKRDDNLEGRNIYEIFNHQIAYEIRLQDAMEEDLLCPFHYFGITDLDIIADAGKSFEEKVENFRYLTSEERVENVMKQAEYFGYSGDRVKGLIFCSRIDEAKELSKKFNDKGWRTLVLSGSDSEEARAVAIERLAGEESEDALDYIISVDIFSEGVDVPEINQVIMLRPTESPIVFIQQLGRGLRKAENKEYVVVLDFIGNYRNNFMIPIALSGDRSYNKDNIRRYVTEGGRVIPGASTIHFDEISRKRIFQAIDNANFSDIKLIRENYTNLKNKLGHIPALADFDKYGEMDVLRIFDNNSLGSYYKFLVKYEKEYTIRLSEDEEKAIEFISKKLASGKRIHELELLKRTLQYRHGIIGRLQKHLSEKYYCEMDEHCTENVINMMTNEFPTSAAKKTYAQCVFLKKEQDDYGISDVYGKMLENPEFCVILEELVDFGISRYKVNYSYHYQDTNLVLYQKYTYEDACRLLNWERNEVPLNIGGYKYDKKTKTFPIFINYDKQDNISDTTKYEDHFVAENRLIAISKSGRSMDSEDVQNFLNATERGIDVQLFVRKNKDDKISKEFYYLGRVIATGNAKQFVMPNTDKTAVEIEWELETPVREDIYQYIVNE